MIQPSQTYVATGQTSSFSKRIFPAIVTLLIFRTRSKDEIRAWPAWKRLNTLRRQKKAVCLIASKEIRFQPTPGGK